MIRLSRARIILLSLAASAAILLVPPVVSRRVRLAAAGLLEPITSAARSLLGGARRRLAAFGRGTELQQDLARERARGHELAARLSETLDDLARMRRARGELRALREALDRVTWRDPPVPANVIRRPGRWESHELILDRGRGSGVERRCPVLVGGAVLGVVAETAKSTARVLTLGHPRLIVPARVVETRQQGLVEVEAGRLGLKYVVRDRDRPVVAGHTVVTSGLGGVFPPGCLIGRVAPGVAPAEGQPFYEIGIDLPRGAGSPEVVWVLVGGRVRGKKSGARRRTPPVGKR